jgi:hypothetical protein
MFICFFVLGIYITRIIFLISLVSIPDLRICDNFKLSIF